MTRIQSLSVPAALLLAAATFATPFAHAKSDAQQRYEQERAACMNGTSNQDRATCLKEAGAALAESKKGNLGADAAMERNRTARCDQLPATDKADCLQRMQEGSTSGTAKDGGILREATKTVPAK